MKILIVLLLGLFLVGCVSVEKQCVVDSDCLGATCCHVSEAVNREHAPDCSGQLCTMDCEPGTTDCGQGEVQCVSGSCEVVLS